jgi:F-type H+-transporting ATPase subunit epsilon
MAHTKFTVEILTPEGEVFNDEVEMVSTRTALGVIGILANHEPLLATLDPTELRLHVSDGEIRRYAQAEGYIQVGGNHAMLLVEEAFAPDQLDAAQLRERLQEAERELHEAGDDTAKHRAALRDKNRWEAFLRIAEGGS